MKDNIIPKGVEEEFKWIDSLKNRITGTERIINETVVGLTDVGNGLDELINLINKIDTNLSERIKLLTSNILKKIDVLSKYNELQKKEIIVAKNELDKGISLIKSFYERTTKDELTGLWNGEYINNLLDVLWEQNKDFTFLFIDLNDLKKINDTYGHQAGDMLIKTFGLYLSEIFGHNKNYIGRIHGDEFNIISLDNQKELEKKILLLNKWSNNKTILIKTNEGEDKKINFSFGIGKSYSHNVNTIAELIHIADKTMYKDKFVKKTLG